MPIVCDPSRPSPGVQQTLQRILMGGVVAGALAALHSPHRANWSRPSNTRVDQAVRFVQPR